MSSIAFDRVAVAYGRREVVAPFTEQVQSGEWLGLIGPNGAGKSSLLRAAVGLIASSGAVAVDGVQLGELHVRERAQLVAYVPQEPLIPNDMTVADYVLLGRTPYVSYFGTETGHDREIAGDVIDRLRLGDFAARMLGSLSGGERQRVVIARALAQQAPVLLLDEPTSALDIGHQQQALELVTELREHSGLTVISAMHDLTLAGIYTDRLVMLDRGRVVASGPASEVLTAERLGDVFHVCVTVDVDPDDGAVIVVPRRGFPAE
jgi:iron complex transport system ATP-binding protein